MAAKKTVFIAFAMEDKACRDLLKGQSLNTDSPFEFIDMSVKESYNTEWKKKVRTRIRRSDGVIALISKSTKTSSGQKWEISCSKDEGVPIRGFWCYKDDRTNIEGVNTKVWTWENFATFIDSL